MSGSVAYRAAPGTSIDYLTTFWGSFIPLIRWLLTGKSILGGLVPPGAAFVRSDDPTLPYSSKASPDIVAKDATSGKNAPDLELIYAPLSFLTTNDNKAPGTNVIAVVGPTPLCDVTLVLTTLCSSQLCFVLRAKEPSHLRQPIPSTSH